MCHLWGPGGSSDLVCLLVGSNLVFLEASAGQGPRSGSTIWWHLHIHVHPTSPRALRHGLFLTPEEQSLRSVETGRGASPSALAGGR